MTDGPHETPEFIDNGVPFLSAESIVENKLVISRMRGYISRDLHEEYSKKCKPQRNDIFLVKSGSTTGKSAIVETDEEFNVWSPLCLIRSNTKKIKPQFFFQSLQSGYFRKSVELAWSFGTQPNIGMNVVENLKIILPTLSEQTLISQYLDKKTSQIDSQIEKIEQKIELLKEQRASLINHCVTKGLNPDAEMKDSGIEWIGEIPSHWGIKRIKYIGTRKSGDGFPIELQNDEMGTIPFFKVSDTNNEGNETYLTNSNNYVTEIAIKEMKFKVFKPGSIAFPKIGEVLRNNKRRILGEFGCIDNNMMGLEIQTKDSSKFLYYVLSQVDFSLYCSDGTVPSISETQVGNINIPIPSEKEQINIVDYLDVRLEAITSLIEKELNRVELLKEYRQSLISNVVTGKIRITEEMI